MAAALDEGRRRAAETERLRAYRESARRVATSSRIRSPQFVSRSIVCGASFGRSSRTRSMYWPPKLSASSGLQKFFGIRQAAEGPSREIDVREWCFTPPYRHSLQGLFLVTNSTPLCRRSSGIMTRSAARSQRSAQCRRCVQWKGDNHRRRAPVGNGAGKSIEIAVSDDERALLQKSSRAYVGAVRDAQAGRNWARTGDCAAGSAGMMEPSKQRAR
jgi:hypothetical protein